MDIDTVRSFFMWCTIINVAILAYSVVICAVAGNFIYRMHGKWFAMPRETFNVVIYSYLGLFKVLVITLNLVPYIALVILG